MDADFMTFKTLIDNAQTEKDVVARFYDRSVKTDDVNQQTGLPIFKNVCYVEIRIKNNNTDIFNQPATPEKMARFPVEYNRYLSAKKECKEGTPLEHFSFLTTAQIDTLKYHGILSVEQLSSLQSEQAVDLGVLSEFESAKRFVSLAQNHLTESQWQKKVETLEAQIRDLEQQLQAKTQIQSEQNKPTEEAKQKSKRRSSAKKKEKKENINE